MMIQKSRASSFTRTAYSYTPAQANATRSRILSLPLAAVRHTQLAQWQWAHHLKRRWLLHHASTPQLAARSKSFP